MAERRDELIKTCILSLLSVWLIHHLRWFEQHQEKGVALTNLLTRARWFPEKGMRPDFGNETGRRDNPSSVHQPQEVFLWLHHAQSTEPRAAFRW